MWVLKIKVIFWPWPKVIYIKKFKPAFFRNDWAFLSQILFCAWPKYQVSVSQDHWSSGLAHLSRRLTGELLVYPCSVVCRRSIRCPSVVRSLSVRCPAVVRPFTFSNIFFSETAWPIKAKFYVKPPWVGGTNVCSRHPGHMTKMAATPIYGKNPSKIFSETGRPISTKLCM